MRLAIVSLLISFLLQYQCQYPYPQNHCDKEIHSIDIPEVFQIIVNCEDEDEQRAVFEQLVSEGRNCKIAML